MQIRKSIQRQLAAIGLVAALLLCGQGWAQVMDQVPSDALAVVRVKDLGAVNKKAVKMATRLGLDNADADFRDPLGAVEDAFHLGNGVDKTGDLAIVFEDPQKFGNEGKSVLVLFPIVDYKAFLGNFKSTHADGELTKAKPVDRDEDIYIAHWGNFAAISLNKDIVSRKPDGLKLEGIIAREAEAKDAILYANVAALRAAELADLKKNGDTLVTDIENEIFDHLPDIFKPLAPVVHGFLGEFLGTSNHFLDDGRGAILGVKLSDDGISISSVTDFDPDSTTGKLAREIKNTDKPLLAGLPDRKYFAYSGATNNPQGLELLREVLEPLEADFAQTNESKKLLPAIDSLQKSAGGGAAIGWVAPTNNLGAESVLEFVVAVHGDVKATRGSVDDMLNAASEAIKSIPQDKDISVKLVVTPNARTVEGVKLDTFELKPKINQDDPNGAEVKQIMDQVFAKNGLGGVVGEVNDKSMVVVLGGSDQLIAESVAAGKNETDLISERPGVKAVAGELPKDRAAVAYLDLGEFGAFLIQAVKEEGMALNIKLRPNLPPIGMTAGSDGSAIRFDVFIPTSLVEGLTSAVMQGMQQERNGPGGGL